MAIRQTRGSLSLRAEVDERLRLAADYLGTSVTQYAEAALIEQMDTDGVPELTREEALDLQRRRRSGE